MTTKYNIGDVVLLPFVITEIHAYDKDDCNYEGYIKTDSEQPLGLPREELDICAVYNKGACRKMPSELRNKRLSLIKQLREANGFTYEEISMIMNMDEDIVIKLLSNDES